MLHRATRARFNFLLSCLLYCTACFGDSAVDEYVVKAAFLYNFARFVTWPDAESERADSPYHICILGNDPFGNALQSIRDKQIHGRPLVFSNERSVADLQTCKVIFISSSEAAHIKQIISELKQRAVLTISDTPNFADYGGVISFLTINNKIRFEVNMRAAQGHHLQISSKLLRLAVEVYE